MKIFTTGFIQVYLVCLNTYFISNDMVLGICIVSFLISLVWSHNVTKISISSFKMRINYSLGASIGGVLGYLTGKLFL